MNGRPKLISDGRGNIVGEEQTRGIIATAFLAIILSCNIYGVSSLN